MNDLNFKEKQHNQSSHMADSKEIDIGEIFSIIKSQKKFILLVVSIIFVLAFVYTLRIQPIYETSALIQVADQSSGLSNVLNGSDSSNTGFSLFSNKASQVEIEEALMKSRFIIQPTVENLGLNTRITPRYFPIFGSFIAHHYSKDGLAKPLFGLSKYAWGGENVVVKHFIVPKNYTGHKFIIKILSRNTFVLYTNKREVVLHGIVGKTVQSKDSSIVPGVKILITSDKANPGLEIYITLLPSEAMIGQIAGNLHISDIGKNNSGGGETGVLNVSLTGHDAAKLPIIVNTLIQNDIQKNIEKKTAEAKKALDFLQSQSASLKTELDKAETALTSYRSTKGGIGVSAASKVLLDQMVTIEKSIFELKLKKIELLQDFTARHPYVIAVTQQQQRLQSELLALESQVKTLPKTEQHMLSLEREVRVKNTLYSLILSKMQQLQLVRAGTISDIRILDLATTPNRIASRSGVILLGSIIFGLILAIGAIFLRQILSQGMDDPDYVEERLGLPLYAVVPFSKNQQQMIKDKKRNLPQIGPLVLATKHNKDLAIESLRSLRTILLLSLQKAKNNVVSIMGASPNIGKSFVAINLAYVLADGGRKVLLIDSDLRRGKMHTNLLQSAYPGLTEILGEKESFERSVRSLNGKVFVNGGNIDFIPCGSYPSNPAELLFDGAMEKFVAKIASEYDVVLIDTPPIMVAADAAIITKSSATNLLMLGSGSENIKLVEHALKRLQKHHIRIQGMVFNTTKPSQSTAYGYGKVYGYYYRDQSEEPK